MNHYIVGILYAAATAICFGLVTPFTRVVFESGASPEVVVGFRYVMMFVFFAFVVVLTGRRWRPNIEWRTAVVAVIGWFAVSVGHLGAVKYIPVSLSAIIFYTFPLLVLIVKRFTEGEPLGIFRLSAFLLAFLGLVIALGANIQSLDMRGVALAAMASVGSTVYFLANDRFGQHADPVSTAFFFSTVSLVLVVPWVLLSKDSTLPTGALGWSALMVVGGATSLAFMAMLNAVKKVGALTTTLIMNLEPVTILILSSIVVGEQLTARKVIGVSLVVCGLMLAHLGNRKRIKMDQKPE